MKQIIDTECEDQEKTQKISMQKNRLVKSIEVLDFQIEKLYEDKLNLLFLDIYFSNLTLV